MKINDYARIKNYGIKKLLDIGEFLGMKQYLIDEDGTYVIDNSIIKSSLNIIDLIEVGDYVNGSKVQEIGKDYVEIEEYSGLNNDMPCIVKTKDIKSIVTKEQFESMKYEVE